MLGAIDPRTRCAFFAANGWHGFVVLGAVFLAVTGGEALYADMGHFGRRPIRLAWFALVLPALVLNYFGQGALLLLDPRGGVAAVLPAGAVLGAAAAGRAGHDGGDHRVAGADLGRVLADAAGDPARLRAAPRHRSTPRRSEMGQIYVPQVNWALMVATILIVIGFESSSALAAAYGIAVTMTMVDHDDCCVHVVARRTLGVAALGDVGADGDLPHRSTSRSSAPT